MASEQTTTFLCHPNPIQVLQDGYPLDCLYRKSLSMEAKRWIAVDAPPGTRACRAVLLLRQDASERVRWLSPGATVTVFAWVPQHHRTDRLGGRELTESAAQTRATGMSQNSALVEGM
jgi:hypothetical protein